MQGFELVAGSRPGTLWLPWPPAPAWQGSVTPWGHRTSATLLLAGNVSSSQLVEGLGAELALGTGCSFWESDGSSFPPIFGDLLRVLTGWFFQACQVCLYYPDVWSVFTFPLLAIINNMKALVSLWKKCGEAKQVLKACCGGADASCFSLLL